MATQPKTAKILRDIPDGLAGETIDTITRIEKHHSVLGTLYIKNNLLRMCTLPETMTQTLCAQLPVYTARVHQALTEIQFRAMKVMSNLLKDSRDEWLVKTTTVINKSNPIIDRIMEDDSVEGVIMTNKEGAPILTNISTTRATNYGIALHPFGHMAQASVKELNAFDEVLVTRIRTKKVEIMLAPHPEFNIIVIQQGRTNTHKKENM